MLLLLAMGVDVLEDAVCGLDCWPVGLGVPAGAGDEEGGEADAFAFRPSADALVPKHMVNINVLLYRQAMLL